MQSFRCCTCYLALYKFVLTLLPFEYYLSSIDNLFTSLFKLAEPIFYGTIDGLWSMAWSWLWGQEIPWTVTYNSSGKTLCRYNFIQVNTICKTQLNFDSVFFMYLITLSMVLYFFTIWENGLHALPCYLMLFFFLFFFPSYIFVLSCRSSLVNHTDLERLFCLEDFLTWEGPWAVDLVCSCPLLHVLF